MFTFFKQDTKKGLKHVHLNNNGNKINIIFYATNEEKAYICRCREISLKKT